MKKRETGIDLVKACAVVFVVLAHALTDQYSKALNFNNLSLIARIYYNVVSVITSMGVPLFLMSSGYFMFRRKMSISQIFKRRIMPLYFGFLFWNSIVWIFYCLNGGQFNFQSFILSSLLLKNPLYRYLWYIPVLIGIYLLLPLTQEFIEKLNKEHFYYLAVFVLIFTSFDFYNLFAKKLGLPIISNSMEIYVSNFIPILFTFIGYYCSKFLKFGTNKRLIRVILGISFLLTLATQILLKDIGVGYRVYSYPFGILLSFSTFHFLGSLSTSNPVNTITYLLSSYSLGFY